jgi:hypothetical protein
VDEGGVALGTSIKIKESHAGTDTEIGASEGCSSRKKRFCGPSSPLDLVRPRSPRTVHPLVFPVSPFQSFARTSWSARRREKRRDTGWRNGGERLACDAANRGKLAGSHGRHE